MPVAVAHNDSAQGRAAVRAGAEEAWLRDTELVVIHVVEIAGTDPGEVTQHEVERDVTDLLGDSGDPTTWRVVTATAGGDPAGAIVDLATEANARLLVIGSRRRSAVGKLLMGSTVQRILLEAPLPVLVVKAAQD